MIHVERGTEMDEVLDGGRKERVQVRIGDQVAYVDVDRIAGSDEEEVSARLPSLDDFTSSLSAITDTVSDAIAGGFRKIKPDKITLEFGFEVGVESGKLTAILVKGSAKANIKVVAEWTPEA
ncbi:CU044_2847 family protein [Saccharothrix sp. NRRL B-16348]|uniref:CU044_2847 family protein n=1 Tax=Saccharothrix sp. NRRL B-16348 TaxID=1415542 RepID=UPI000A620370|nr:CU044_2847 family protein [Saccharothrix sp. NRRL B-16348]